MPPWSWILFRAVRHFNGGRGWNSGAMSLQRESISAPAQCLDRLQRAIGVELAAQVVEMEGNIVAALVIVAIAAGIARREWGMARLSAWGDEYAGPWTVTPNGVAAPF